MAFPFSVAFSFPVARNGSIRFELMRNENIGPSLRQALQFIEEIVGKCNASEITGPHVWFHAMGILFDIPKEREFMNVYDFLPLGQVNICQHGQPKGRMN